MLLVIRVKYTIGNTLVVYDNSIIAPLEPHAKPRPLNRDVMNTLHISDCSHLREWDVGAKHLAVVIISPKPSAN